MGESAYTRPSDGSIRRSLACTNHTESVGLLATPKARPATRELAGVNTQHLQTVSGGHSVEAAYDDF